MRFAIGWDYIVGFQVGFDINFDEDIALVSLGVVMLAFLWGKNLRSASGGD